MIASKNDHAVLWSARILQGPTQLVHLVLRPR